MRTPYYREQALEGIAREVITAYDPNLYYGVPRMIPIEDIIEAGGITLEYQCLRKSGCVLGETIFDDGGAIIYDYDIPGYGRASDALTFSVLLRIPRLRPPSLPSNIGELSQRKNKQGAETHVFVLAGAGRFSTTID